MGRSSDAKSRLLETAMTLMAIRGFTAVGVQEICVQAGVKKGSFFHFFPSKQTLVLAVIDAWEQQLHTLWAQAMTADCPPLERLTRLFALTYDAQQTRQGIWGQMYGCPIGNLTIELSSQDILVRQKVQAIFSGWAATVEQALHEAVTTGTLPAMDIGITAQAIVAYFEGVMLLAKTHNDPAVVARLAHGAVHLVLAASSVQLPART
jgi:TetR/AcrR family transcriptional regulator, transcriptional repressor for nem operon